MVKKTRALYLVTSCRDQATLNQSLSYNEINYACTNWSVLQPNHGIERKNMSKAILTILRMH